MRRCPFAVVLVLGACVPSARAADAVDADLEKRFTGTVRPFLKAYCTECHGGEKPKADLDLSRYTHVADVARDGAQWATLQEKLVSKEMPPEEAEKHPAAAERQPVIDWIATLRRHEAQKNAGDPGPVLPRRLSNAEYNYTIRDLTGVDIRPAREFPVDPANQEGFDNSGESLAMSPALLTKYLQAAREVASHLVLKPQAFAFAPHPMLVETDRDKYAVNQIMEFYRRQATDYADYFRAAWHFKHRATLGQPEATLADIAARAKVSPKYLATVWRALEETREEVGPGAKLQAMWRVLPAPVGASLDDARGRRQAAPLQIETGCTQMRDFVVTLRKKLEPRFANLNARGLSGTSQPLLMWKNRQYASHRMSYDRDALQLDGQAQADKTPVMQKKESIAANDAVEEDALPTSAIARQAGDPDLFVPAGERAHYEASFARFCAVFPDAFYVSERGRNYLDKTRDRGRYLSAGFHNLMGYFRDDQPLYELVLDDAGRQQLDAMWRELDFVASACIRTHVQFYFNESGEARDPSKRAEERDVTTETMIRKVADNYMARAKSSGNETAIRAVQEHFDAVNASIRWVERARLEAEPSHLEALQAFAARAYRRPLSETERADLLAYYRTLREKSALSHEEAMRDCIVSILMYPDFCYHIDMVDAAAP